MKPPERTPQLGQNGLTNKAQDNNENDYQRKNSIEPYYLLLYYDNRSRVSRAR